MCQKRGGGVGGAGGGRGGSYVGVMEGVGEGRWSTTGVAAVVFAVQTVWRPSGSGEAKARSVCPANTSACLPLLTKKLTQHLCPGKDDHHATGHLWAAAAWSAGLHALREGQRDPEMRTDGSRQARRPERGRSCWHRDLYRSALPSSPSSCH